VFIQFKTDYKSILRCFCSCFLAQAKSSFFFLSFALFLSV
jgi:hypothetical protein